MNERVTVGVRTFAAAVLAAVFCACAPEAAQAQTTVVLDAPGSDLPDDEPTDDPDVVIESGGTETRFGA